MLKVMVMSIVVFVVSVAAMAETSNGARRYLETCLTLGEIKLITGFPVATAEQQGNPQDTCSYTNSEQLSKQSRVVYSRDSGYRTAFGESDIMQKVTGLGNFAEYDMEGGQLYVNVGSDGLMFEGRQGKQKLPLEKLKAIAEKVLQQP